MYYITKKYVNKCDIISQEEKEKNLKKRERYLEVVSTDEEDSIEKEQAIILNKNKRGSSKKIRINLIQLLKIIKIIFIIKKIIYIILT